MLANTRWNVNWAAVGAIAAVIAIPCTLFFPEVRRWVGVDAQNPPVTTSKNNALASDAGREPSPVLPKNASANNKTIQDPTTKVARNKDVPEINAAENGNVAGDTEPRTPSVHEIAPSGIHDLSGVWLGNTSGGGLLRVRIQQSGTYLTATPIKGWEGYIPSRHVAFWGTYDSSVFPAHQICAYAGFKQPYWEPITIRVTDASHFIEEDARGGCGGGGFPVKWERKPPNAPDFP